MANGQVFPSSVTFILIFIGFHFQMPALQRRKALREGNANVRDLCAREGRRVGNGRLGRRRLGRREARTLRRQG